MTGALVGASLLVGGVAQAAPIKITQDMLPLVISQPGSYVFAGNLSYSESTDRVIQILASGVDLNGAGYTLTGTGRPMGIVVDAPSGSISGVRIHDVNVTGFYIGIGVGRADNVTLTGNTASGSFYGFYVGGSNNILAGNTASGNEYGFQVSGSNNVLTGNSAANNGSAGIFLHYSTGSLVQGNTASGNRLYGIVLYPGATGNTVQGNSAGANGRNGISAFLGATGNLVKGNTALGSLNLDLYDENPPATSWANLWQGNSFNTSGGAGAGGIR
jgi:parallel beta-helix repeat protein